MCQERPASGQTWNVKLLFFFCFFRLQQQHRQKLRFQVKQFCSIILKYNPEIASLQHLDITSSLELAYSCFVIDEVSSSYSSNVKSSTKFCHKVQCQCLPLLTLLLLSSQTYTTRMTVDIPLVDVLLTCVFQNTLLLVQAGKCQ